jgi:hypothetical protein
LEKTQMSEQNPWEDFKSPIAPPTGATGDASPWESFQKPVAPFQAIPGVTPAPAAPPDKYRQAALENRERFIKAGAENVLPEGYTARLGRGVGLGWTDELLAAGATPIEMARRGVGPAEAYRYAKAEQDLAAEKTAEKTAGPLGTATEIMGGLTTGAGAFGGARAAAIGIPFTQRAIPAGVVNYGQNVLKGGALGTIAGAGEGNTFDERFQGAKMGGVIGLGAGAVLPPIASTIGAALRPFKAIPHLRDPEVIAAQDVAKVARDSGVPIEEAVKRVTDARAAGQTEYTLADAFGNAGQRKLTGMAKVPGPAREQIVEALTERNLNMPHRVGSEIGQALGAPTTAAQATERLIDQARRQSSPLYKQAESVPTWSDKLQGFLESPLAKQGLAEGAEIQGIRVAGTGRASKATDDVITNFDPAIDPKISGVPSMRVLNTLKIGLDRMIEREINPATMRLNEKGAAIADYKNRLLAEIDALNPAYREARSAYRGPMEIKDAVQQGREMATRGRPADTIPAVTALTEAEQRGVGIGYADKVREQLERTGNFPSILREKVPKGVAELEQLSQYQGPRQPGRPDQLRQFLTREEEMQRTSKAALGGSPTAENIADVAAGPGGAEVLGLAGSAMSGSPTGIARSVLDIGRRYARGENEAQRAAITRVLLENQPDALRQVADRIARAEERRRGVNPWTGGYRYRP